MDLGEWLGELLNNIPESQKHNPKKRGVRLSRIKLKRCVLYGCPTLLRYWRIIPATRWSSHHTWDILGPSQTITISLPSHQKIRNIFKITQIYPLVN
jgi:hypothetical protein